MQGQAVNNASLLMLTTLTTTTLSENTFTPLKGHFNNINISRFSKGNIITTLGHLEWTALDLNMLNS